MCEARVPEQKSSFPPLLQRSTAWFSARLGKVNASELDRVLGFGFGRNGARRKVFDCLRDHRAPEPFSNDATMWGQEHETEALVTYMERCSFVEGLRSREHGGRTHPEHEWLRASPDALLYNEADELVGLVEIKAPYRLRDKPPPTIDSHIPLGYVLQMNLQMEVYDVGFCDFVQWTPHGITVRRIRRNKTLFAFTQPLYEGFYNHATKSSDPYQRLDPSEVTRIETQITNLFLEIGITQAERSERSEQSTSINSSTPTQIS